MGKIVACYRNVLSCVTQMHTHTCTQMEVLQSKDLLCATETGLLLFSKGRRENIAQMSAETKTFALESLPARRIAHRISPSHRVDGISP